MIRLVYSHDGESRCLRSCFGGARLLDIKQRALATPLPKWSTLGIKLFRRIAECCPADSLFNLVDVCREYRAHSLTLQREQFLSNRVERGLRVRGIDAEFMIAVRADNAVISGSALLQMLLGEQWPGSDIDVFRMHDGTRRFGVRGEHRPLNQFIAQSRLHERAAPKSEVIRRYMNLVKEARTTGYHGVQIIDCICRPIDLIRNAFDLDFCKIWYDGRRFCVERKRAIAGRESPFHVCNAGVVTGGDWVQTWCWMHFGRRICKYWARGFTIRGSQISQRRVPRFGPEFKALTVIVISLHDRMVMCAVRGPELLEALPSVFIQGMPFLNRSATEAATGPHDVVSMHNLIEYMDEADALRMFRAFVERNARTHRLEVRGLPDLQPPM